MDPIIVGILGIISLVICLILGIHIGITMLVVGFAGFAAIAGFDSAIGLMRTVPYSTAANYALTVIPLFVLMGQFAFYSGLSQNLYSVTYKWLGRLPGGLAMATVGACGGFAAICGSSPATAATMGTVALPEMEKYNYSKKLATGSIAAGGTLGILIPPSVGFILYGIMAEQSIGRLFSAGVIPGILLVILYCLAVYWTVKKDPEAGPRGPEITFIEKVKSFREITGVLILFLVVIGGMFAGLFTANEAAAVGAFSALLFMIFRRKFTKENALKALLSTIETVAMLFIILIGAYIFGYFLTVSNIPRGLADFVIGLDVSRYVILFGILLVYMFLGCIMDSLAMVVLTVPIFLPIVLELGFDPIWFGVIMVMVMEQGLITPPVGMNVYIISGLAKDVPITEIFKGIFPFFLAILIAVFLLILIPDIALFLPNLLYN